MDEQTSTFEENSDVSEINHSMKDPCAAFKHFIYCILIHYWYSWCSQLLYLQDYLAYY